MMTGTSSPVPPSKGTPSIVPVKEIVTRSPLSALPPSALAAKGRFWSAIFCRASSMSWSGTVVVSRSSLIDLKSASAIGGTTSSATV